MGEKALLTDPPLDPLGTSVLHWRLFVGKSLGACTALVVVEYGPFVPGGLKALKRNFKLEQRLEATLLSFFFYVHL